MCERYNLTTPKGPFTRQRAQRWWVVGIDAAQKVAALKTGKPLIYLPSAASYYKLRSPLLGILATKGVFFFTHGVPEAFQRQLFMPNGSDGSSAINFKS